MLSSSLTIPTVISVQTPSSTSIHICVSNFQLSVNNQQISALSSSTGIPQGSIVDPLPFSLYVNHLPSTCGETETQMFAAAAAAAEVPHISSNCNCNRDPVSLCNDRSVKKAAMCDLNEWYGFTWTVHLHIVYICNISTAHLLTFNKG